MKINKYILGAGALLCMMLPAASAQAQDVKLKCMEWNIKSFEYDDNSNAVYFEIAEAMEKIKAENPDIVCFNEFETATGREADRMRTVARHVPVLRLLLQ